MWIGIGGAIAALVVLLVICVAVSKSNQRRAASAAQQLQASQSAAAEGPEKLTGLDELGGLTMQEWMQKYGKNNAELKARQNRIRQVQRGADEIAGRKTR